MKLVYASQEAITYSCKNYHYSKSGPINPVGYAVFNGKKEFCGTISFAIGANKEIATPYGLKQGQVIELVRVSLNGRQESTSKAISIALKLVKKDIPLARLVVSYADCDQGHIGTVYQATNWYYEGKKQEGNVWGYIVKGKKMHKRTMHHEFEKRKLNQGFAEIKMFIDPNAEEIRTKGKHKYLYPLHPNMVKLCKTLHKPYPKKVT